MINSSSFKGFKIAFILYTLLTHAKVVAKQSRLNNQYNRWRDRYIRNNNICTITIVAYLPGAFRVAKSWSFGTV